MATTTSISHPSSYCCLPTANAVVDGNYDANASKKDGVEYFVRVTVGTTQSQNEHRSTSVSGNWTYTFPQLTAANDVTVTAQLMKSINGATPVEVGDPSSVAHVDIKEVCTIATSNPGGIFETSASPSGTTGKTPPPKPNRHLSVYWPYDASYETRILRAVAIVLKFETGRPPEVWAVSEGTAHHGVTTAVIPIPHTAAGTTYKYYFALFSRIDNGLLTRSPLVDHPSE